MRKKSDSYKQAIRQFKKGEDKIEIFEKYKDSVGEFELARLLAMYPDHDIGREYEGKNKILLVAVSVLAVMKSISIISLLLLEFNILLLLFIILILAPIIIGTVYGVFIKHVLVYRLLACFSLYGLLKSISSPNYIGFESIFDWVWFLIAAVASLVCVWLGFYLSKRMFPYHGWFKSKESINGIPVFTEKQRASVQP